MDIKLDDLSGAEILQLLAEHLADMHATSPPESVHALNVDELKAPHISVYSAWDQDQLLGCVAIKRLNKTQVELKSMRTSRLARNSGVASQLLQHVLNVATNEQFETIFLETGTEDYFIAARNLYTKFGFVNCAPFADYQLDPNSQYMSRGLGDSFAP